MSKLQIGTAEASNGEASFGTIPVAELNDGSSIEIPVCVMNGAVEGPLLWIQNGVHGDEYVGAAAIGQLIREVDLASLRGCLILIPMLNMQAYQAGSRMAPQDGLDMNRSWPGAPMERAMHLWAHTEIVAHTVLQLIKEHADVLLDVHDAGRMGLMSPYVAYYEGPTPEFEERVRAIASASGMELVWTTKKEWIDEKVPGSIKTEMTKAQIPSITLEIGGEGRLNPEHVASMYRSYLNVMKHLDMIEGKPDIPARQIHVTKGNWIRAPLGGMLYPHVNPLDSVENGQQLATITDLFGRTRKTLLSPAQGWVVGIRTLGTVASGQYVVNVAESD